MSRYLLLGRRSSPAAWPAFLAAYSEIAIALVVFAILLRIAIGELGVSAAAAIFGPVPAPLIVPLTFMAVVVAVQLAVALTLRAPEERVRRIGMLGAGTLALIGGLIAATLVVAVGMLLAAFVIDSAQGLRPADLNEILAQLGIAKYVSAQGMAIAVPITGWLAFLNARSALYALGEIGDKRAVAPLVARTRVQGG